MKEWFEKLKNKCFYLSDSVKNRYPCRLVRIKNYKNSDEKTLLTYQAVTRFNLRESTVEDILNDPMIVEKFHPTDAVKIGFLSAWEMFFKNNDIDIGACQKKYEEIILNMFDGVSK